MAELIVPICGIFSAWALEAYKGRNKGIMEKLSASDTQNLAMLIQASQVAVTELEDMIHDFEDAMDRHQSMTTTRRFQSWRQGVSDIVEDVTISVQGLRNLKTPAIVSFSKDKKKDKIHAQLLLCKTSLVDLLNRGLCFLQNPESFLVPPPSQHVVKIKNVPEIKAFPSLQKPLEETLRLLDRNNVTSIAICGTLGAGKTTVLHNLNNCEDVAKLFDLVIFLDGRTVSSDENMLQEIARRVKLTDHITAESVSIALSKYKKCLLLCDDVRRDLKPVIDELEMCSGSRIVLTSRSEFTRICQPMADMMIELPSSLTPDEAWKMFKRVVGEHVINKPGIEKEARKVLELCSRIPVLIKTIASSFVRKDRAEYWRAELRKLKQQKRHKMKGLEEIYTYWMSCYNQLRDDMANCFLYAALHPGATKICTQHMIESWTEEGLIDIGVEPMTRCQMLDEGQVVLKELTDLAFLDKHNNKTMFVEMNSSIQEFAMHVQSERGDKSRVVVKIGAVESPTPEDWTMASRISMVDNNVCKLPESTACENLLTLLLQKNSTLTTIPPSFFRLMTKLVLLDLYKTGIAELPSSVSNLVALKALYLNGCDQLIVLPAEIKKLESLEVLDIRDTKIYYIPEHIWSLVKLKCLRTSYTGTPPPNQKEVKDHDVVLGLPVLEELVIYVKSYQNWCCEVKHIIRLVAGMKSLTNLRFCFPDTETVKTFLAACTNVFGNLSSFHFYVGCENKYCPEIMERLGNEGIVQYLRYCDGKNDGTDTIKCILASSEALELVGHKDIITLSELGTKSFKSVYDCVIESCDKMVTLSEVNVDIGDMLPHLQKLYFRGLRSLESIAEAEMLSNFWGLKFLQLKDCPKLTKLFSQGVLEKLSELETLELENCGKMEELILKPRGSKLQVLPELQTLRLLNLPKLTTICADESILWPSLQVLEINECPVLEKLPIRKERAPKLRACEGEQLQN